MRDSIVFYRSFYEAVCELPDEQQLSAIKAILEYGLNDSDDATGTAKAMLMHSRSLTQIISDTKTGRKAEDLKATKPKPKKNQTETKGKPKTYLM